MVNLFFRFLTTFVGSSIEVQFLENVIDSVTLFGCNMVSSDLSLPPISLLNSLFEVLLCQPTLMARLVKRSDLAQQFHVFKLILSGLMRNDQVSHKY